MTISPYHSSVSLLTYGGAHGASSAKRISDVVALCLENQSSRSSRAKWVGAFQSVGFDVGMMIRDVQQIRNEEVKDLALSGLIESQLRILAHHCGVDITVMLGRRLKHLESTHLVGHRPEKVHAILSEAFREISPSTALAMEKSVQYSFVDGPIRAAEEDFRDGLPVTIGSGWHGHATEVSLQGNYLAYTNRARRNPGITIYRIGNKHAVNASWFDRVNDRSKSKMGKEGAKRYLQDGGMIDELGLREITHIPMPKQPGKTCAWSSPLGGLFALEIFRVRNRGKSGFGEAARRVRCELREWEVQHVENTLYYLCSIAEQFPHRAHQILRGDGIQRFVSEMKKRLALNPGGNFNVPRTTKQTARLMAPLGYVEGMLQRDLTSHALEGRPREMEEYLRRRRSRSILSVYHDQLSLTYHLRGRIRSVAIAGQQGAYAFEGRGSDRFFRDVEGLRRVAKEVLGVERLRLL
jgi:hypothetical protein